jgi:hypothetical protein
MAREKPEAFHALAAVEPAKPGERREGLERVQMFLNRFGYLEGGVWTPDELDEQTSAALAKYQDFNGLPVTGEFDESTLGQMTTGRCAFPDMINGIAFTTTCAWRRWSLTYAFDSGTTDTFGGFQAVRNAFATWAVAVPLTFTEVGTNDNPDVRIGWRPANDPDLDMTGPTLAHADFPPDCSVVTTTLPKPVHFDETEVTWSIGAVAGAFDIETVALHELGHIIGLAHSSVSGAVMRSSVAGGTTKRTLTADDIAGAQQLYPNQTEWRWCAKCQGLSFGPGNAQSRCPAGGIHSTTPSGDYSLLHNASAGTPGQQGEWRWCSKCQGLFFGGAPSSVCPAGGAHNKVGSGNYSLIHRS